MKITKQQLKKLIKEELADAWLDPETTSPGPARRTSAAAVPMGPIFPNQETLT